MSASYHPTMSCEELQEKIQELSNQIDSISAQMLTLRENYEVVQRYEILISKRSDIHCSMYNLISYLPK